MASAVTSGSKLSPAVVWAGIIIAAAAAILWKDGPPAGAARDAAADPQRERDFQAVVAGAAWLKRNTKNPASFELVSATKFGDQAICYVYRGTNSFGAVVTNHHVIADKVNSDEAKDWNRHCTGSGGADFTIAKHALR
jgi:hypothetical protein